MALEAKICGVNSREAAAAAAKGGARFVGLVFYPPSPRSVTPEEAAAIAATLPAGIAKVGLFVDPDDATLARILAAVPLDLLQLHGAETPRRVAEIRGRTGLAAMKAIKLARPQDLEGVAAFEAVADRLLFDAKAPPDLANALPGGNAVSFDWRMLSGRRFSRPWMLSGGLNAENLARAVEISGARAVDVSSGVESEPGVKDPERIGAFLGLAAGL